MYFLHDLRLIYASRDNLFKVLFTAVYKFIFDIEIQNVKIVSSYFQ